MVLLIFNYYCSRLVGILASDGELTATAATKGTHFVRLCTFRDIPIVFFQNTPSDLEYLAPGGNEGLTVKSRAQMMSAVACATVPKITVVVGGGYGPSSFAMGGRALQPNFLFSWPHARQAIASPDHQLQTMRQQQGLAERDIDPALLDRLEEECAIHPPSNLVTDAVILPHETRQVLSQALDICTVYRQPPLSEHRLNVLRM
jgi:3-methylcrotonyl-CoA carboxylase beta subunit